jgi:hypothetical protein
MGKADQHLTIREVAERAAGLMTLLIELAQDGDWIMKRP